MADGVQLVVRGGTDWLERLGNVQGLVLSTTLRRRFGDRNIPIAKIGAYGPSTPSFLSTRMTLTQFSQRLVGLPSTYACRRTLHLQQLQVTENFPELAATIWFCFFSRQLCPVAASHFWGSFYRSCVDRSNVLGSHRLKD